MTESQKFEVQVGVLEWTFQFQCSKSDVLNNMEKKEERIKDMEKPLRLMSVGTHENKWWLRGIQVFIKNSFTYELAITHHDYKNKKGGSLSPSFEFTIA